MDTTAVFEARLARLEEHVVSPDRMTADELLARAERCYERGWETLAAIWLGEARSTRLEEIEFELEEEWDE